jgi:predicted nucleotide-binding protein (sugar kinase/HSP70/actin superfamily)
LVVPGAKVRRSVAVPLLVTHTVPSTALFSQNEALALQNTTCPEVRGVPDEVTVAINVITEPAVVVAGVTARVVEVRFAASAAVERKRTLTIKSAGIQENAEKLRRSFLPVVSLCMKVMM